MTIMELTAALGYIGYGYIHAIETGKKKPTAELVLKAADLFEVTTDQLLRDELELPLADTDRTKAPRQD